MAGFKSLTDDLTGGSPSEDPSRTVSNETRQKQYEAEERAKRLSREDDDEVLTLLASGQVRAKWKIEVTFVKNRTTTGLNAVGIQVWESGRHMHGGGDALAFFCRDSREGESGGCGGVIPQDNIGRDGIAYCPHCKMTVNAAHLSNMWVANAYMDRIAHQLAKMFRELGSNADIYIKFHKTDVRYMAMYREKGPDTARRMKGMHIYPLKNILRDTAAGADLVKRMKAFITS